MEYLIGVLELSLAPLEGKACLWAYQCGINQDVVGFWMLQDRLNATRWAIEPRQASLDLGKRLQQLAQKTWGLRCPDPITGPTESNPSGAAPFRSGVHHCIVYGWICAQVGVGDQQTVQAYLLSSLTSLVSAAVRLVPLGHTQGQQILTQLYAPIRQISDPIYTQLQQAQAKDHFNLDLDPSQAEDPGIDWTPCPPLNFSSFAPLQERDCQAHQSLYTRLFQS